MEQEKLITIAKTNFYSISIDPLKNRAYLSLYGYWNNAEDLKDYISDVKTALSKMSKNFTLLVDLTQYMGTTSDIYYLHIEALRLSVNFGLSRAAEVFNQNPLMKMLFEQYSKESGAHTMSFQDKNQSEKWLDLY